MIRPLKNAARRALSATIFGAQAALGSLGPLRKGTVIAAVCCPLASPSCPDHGAIVRLYDYSELRPPSTLMHPGAMIVVLRRNPISAEVLCGPRASLGADWVPQASRTMSAELRKVEGQHFDMEASFMENIRGTAKFKDIAKITMSLSNANITELTDIDVEEGMHKRSQACTNSVRRRLEAEFSVTMVSSALAADVIYSISRDTSTQLDAKAKCEQMSQLAVQLGCGAVAVSETTIKAEGLVWGIRESEFLAAVSIPEVDHTLVDPEYRNFVTEDVAYINPVPEAPVVTPADYDPRDEVWLPDPETNGYRLRRPLSMRPGGAPIYDLRSPALSREEIEIPMFDDLDDAREVMGRGASMSLDH